MYKKLAFIFLLTASLQAMPPKIAQKVEEMHGESDNESGGSSIKSHESPATGYDSHLLYAPQKIELMEEEVSSSIHNLNEAIKESNKEKEELLQKYEKAAELLEEKQKEIEELGKEGQEEIDRLAEQRDEYKKELEESNHRGTILQKENDLFRKLFNMSAQENLEDRMKHLTIKASFKEAN
jgi:DNA anti-recombination protein RmuC